MNSERVVKEIPSRIPIINNTHGKLERSIKIKKLLQICQDTYKAKLLASPKLDTLGSSIALNVLDKNPNFISCWQEIIVLAKFDRFDNLIKYVQNFIEIVNKSAENHETKVDFITKKIDEILLIFARNSLPVVCLPFMTTTSLNKIFYLPGASKIVTSLPVRQVTSFNSVRIDLAGGWTDTPPITYETQFPPSVLNISVLINGERPLWCRCTRLEGYQGIFLREESMEEIPRLLCFRKATEVVQNSSKPSHPGSLISATISLSGLISKNTMDGENFYSFNFGSEPNSNLTTRGIFIESKSSLPRGSGLGTSSILSASILASIWTLLGKKFTNLELIQTVLKIEQLHTTGGGWQDQVGGCIPGGFKLGSIDPISQKCTWEAVSIPEKLRNEVNNRLILIYTGTTRLAKNLLEKVLLRWLNEDEKIYSTVKRLSDGALRGKDLLKSGIFPTEICAEYHQLKKEFTIDSETQKMKMLRMFLTQSELAEASWTAGAGGGGFLYVWLSKDKTVDDLKTALCGKVEFSGMYTCTVEVDFNPMQITFT